MRPVGRGTVFVTLVRFLPKEITKDFISLRILEKIIHFILGEGGWEASGIVGSRLELSAHIFLQKFTLQSNP